MRAVLTILVLAGLALSGVPGATATVPDTAAQYESAGPDGILTVTGPDGTAVCAVDSFGFPVAAGVVQGGVLQTYAPNSGPAANGSLLTVFAGDDVLSVTGYDDWWFDN